MANEALIVAGGAAAVAGVAVLRLAWSRPERSVALNAGGWALMLLAILLSAAHSGAWGISVAALCGMAGALLFLGHAAMLSPAAGSGKASNRRAGMLPEGREPLHLGRRAGTFLIVALAAMVISAGAAIPARSIALLTGAGEANATVIALMAMPLLWTGMAYALLMTESRRSQFRLLGIWAAVAIAGILLELMA